VTEVATGAGFIARAWAAADARDTLVCVGLDPEPERFPASIRALNSPIFEFNKRIVDATAEYACCFKPQFAHYAALGAEDQLLATIRYIHERHPGLPVILDDGRPLAQSNAIILHLAEGSALIPADAYERARMLEWMFWEQYSHEPYVATSRYHMVYLGRTKDQREPMRVERGEKALDLMETMIKGRTWFAGEALSVADIALIAYTRLAHEGGFDMASRPEVMAWIGRAEKALGLPPAGKH